MFFYIHLRYQHKDKNQNVSSFLDRFHIMTSYRCKWHPDFSRWPWAWPVFNLRYIELWNHTEYVLSLRECKKSSLLNFSFIVQTHHYSILQRAFRWLPIFCYKKLCICIFSCSHFSGQHMHLFLLLTLPRSVIFGLWSTLGMVVVASFE